MKKYITINKEYHQIRRIIKKETLKIFRKNLKFIGGQEKYLVDYIYRGQEFGLTPRNWDEFVVLINLFNDSLQNSHLSKELLLIGQYSAAGNIIRTIIENAVLVKYLVINAEKWKEWLEYTFLQERYRIEPLQKKNPRLRILGTVFSTTNMIQNCIEPNKIKSYKRKYLFLCSFTHASMDRFRRISTLSRIQLKIHYSPQFNNELCEGLFNDIFVMIDSLFSSFDKTIKLRKTPTSLKKYLKLRDEFYRDYDPDAKLIISPRK